MTMNGSWGYNAGDKRWKSVADCVAYLVTAASGGGNYLLNIGPKADGSVPAESVKILKAIGKWMGRNGEAIYNSDRAEMDQMFDVLGRWTVKGNLAYLHCFAWPGTATPTPTTASERRRAPQRLTPGALTTAVW